MINQSILEAKNTIEKLVKKVDDKLSVLDSRMQYMDKTER